MIITTTGAIIIAWLISSGMKNAPLQREAQARMDAAGNSARREAHCAKERLRAEQVSAEASAAHQRFLEIGFPIPPKVVPAYRDSDFTAWRKARSV